MDRASSGKGSSPNLVFWARVGVVTLALVTALVAYLATKGDGEGGSAEPESTTSRPVSEDELTEASALLGQPIYWAGPVNGTEVELEELKGGGVRVRYADGEGGESLVIGTYPLADPAKALKRFGARPGAVHRRGADGTEIVFDKQRPTSVYFVDPANTVQIEVFAPDAGQALAVSRSGKVRPAR